MATPGASPSPLRWPGLPVPVLLGFAAALASLVLASVACYAALTARAAASRLVRHTAEAQLAVEEIESALIASDLALEAGAASGDRRHRDRFLRAASKVQPSLERLQRVSVDHAEQRPRIARLAAELEAVGAVQAQVVAQIDAGQLVAARAAAAGDPGRTALSRALASLDELEADGARAHRAREASWRRWVAASHAVFAGAVLVLLVLILVAARLVRDAIGQLRADRAERDRALAVQQRLMAVVSHDLRNPLGGILAGGWTLARLPLPPQASNVARRILAAGGRMERLVGDLLDWSRARSGAPFPISPREADLHEVCERVAEEFRDGDAVRIRVEREGEPRAAFDPDRMAQVVGNLVSNALRHAPPGTAVVVRAVGTPRDVRLEVHDEGPGIPPDARARIFEPFERGPGEGAGGVGLGLFIVRAVVEAHGGSVELSSAPGRTTFVVRLPREATPPRAAAAGTG